jgi:non-heme chloroperoxidase
MGGFMQMNVGLSTEIKTTEVNGARLAYIEKGAGEPVVFIHGALSDFRTWLGQMEAFSENYRAVSYSRRFHQPNGGAGENAEYSRALHTADLIGFLQKLNLGRAHLVGHSYGASMALLAALEKPELVASLTLGEPSPFPDLLDEEGKRLAAEQKSGFDELIRLAESGDLESAAANFLKTVVGADVLGMLPDERRTVVLANAGTLPPMLRAYYDSPQITPEQLKNLKVPALFVSGEFSPPISRVNNEQLNNYLPNSEIKILPGASHGLQIENTDGFNKLVLNFLSAQKHLTEAAALK